MTALAFGPKFGVKGLVNDALTICATVDPDFYRILSGVLDLDAEAPMRGDVGNMDAIEPSDGLEIALRMLTYAHVEAQALDTVADDLPQLELCIRCVSERLQVARVSGSSARMLCC